MNRLFILISLLLFFHVSNAQTFYCNPDTAVIYANEEYSIDVLANDSIMSGNIVGVSTILTPVAAEIHGGYSMYIRPYFDTHGVFAINYKVVNSTLGITDTAVLYLTVLPVKNAAKLDINNVSALINSNGELFWSMYDSSYYEIPKGSGRNTVFSASVQMGALNGTNPLVMGDRYSTDGNFFNGPLDTVNASYSAEIDSLYKRVWKISKNEIDYHRFHWWESSYIMPDAIANWPAHGDPMHASSSNLAPFFDINQNGLYEPLSGDYPFIKGDQAVFFIYNTPYNYYNSDSIFLGIEIHGLAYAYNCPQDTVVQNSIFIDYEIINRSPVTYQNTYLSYFFDTDIGYHADDYMGCFVDLNSVYGYNGDNFDDSTNSNGYGANPPAQALTLLKGTEADVNDGVDNNFNGITDEPNEDIAMVAMNNGPYVGNPLFNATLLDQYMAMAGQLSSTLPLFWFNDTTNSTYNYMYPGISDTAWRGCNGIPQTPLNWTENEEGTFPYDRRMNMNMGPFTFYPGQSKTFTLAYIYAQNDSMDNLQVVNLLRSNIEKIISYYQVDSIPCGGSFSAIDTSAKYTSIRIFPNPARNNLNIEFEQENDYFVQIFDISGKLVLQKQLNRGENQIEVSLLKSGMYIVRAQCSKNVFVGKFLKE
ncbi:MAG: T9SS type A sorting domain-containing protein [Bacteroidales bacterium]|nr:T9SS type A sorting domain-containing protein [Bacteroidales bacterium]